MSDRRYGRDELRLSEDELRDVLLRARQLDARAAGGYSFQDVREIALQAGISDAGISRVLDDLVARRNAEAIGPPRLRSMIFSGMATGFAVGIVLYYARENAAFVGDAIYLAVFALALLPVLASAIVLTGSRTHRRYQILNLTTWTTVGLVWSAVGGPTSEIADLFIVTGALAGLGSLLGEAILAFRSGMKRIESITRRLRSIFRRRQDPASDITESGDRLVQYARAFAQQLAR